MKRLLLLVMLMLNAGISSAAIEERDFILGSGDNLITFDSNSKLEWLDITVTKGIGYSEIQNNWSNLTNQGFRYATQDELGQLMDSFGLELNKNYFSVFFAGRFCCDAKELQALQQLQGIIGITYSPPLIGDSSVVYDYTLGFLSRENNVTPVASLVLRALSGPYALKDGATTFVENYPNEFADAGYGFYGSFLVRVASPVPEPWSYSLMLLGLGLCGWVTRKQII